MTLNVSNLQAQINNKIILKNISFNIKENKTLAIIGQSGAGKTTLLRCISGLQKYSGQIFFDDKLINDVPTAKRNIGLVTQDNSLFPHLTIYENIAYPLKIRKMNKLEIKNKVDKFLEKFKIKNLTNRLPQEISGGEAQRAALARSLIYEPRLLLLDEPFAQLDAILKYDLINWLKQVLQEQKILTLFVTHNLREAELVSDEVLFLNNGQVEIKTNFSELKKTTNKNILNFLNKAI